MTRCALLFLLLGCLAWTAYAYAQPPKTPPSNWKLTFDEEFTNDLSRWQMTYPWSARWNASNAEAEVYVDPSYMGTAGSPLGLNPFKLEGGTLTITADVPSAAVVPFLQGHRYTSGMLTTYASFSQMYGYFEISAKFPGGKGLWPAFWLLPTNMSWPPEIDVVEVLGDQPTTLYATVHYGAAGKIQFPLSVSDVTSEFHSYGLYWTKNYIGWYVDSKRVAYAPTPVQLQDKPMYLLLNLAVGGNWPGYPDQSTPFPAQMQVNYVRVYASE